MNVLASVIITVIASPIGTVGVGGGAGDTIKKRPGTVPPASISALAVSPDEQWALTGSARGELASS